MDGSIYELTASQETKEGNAASCPNHYCTIIIWGLDKIFKKYLQQSGAWFDPFQNLIKIWSQLPSA